MKQEKLLAVNVGKKIGYRLPTIFFNDINISIASNETYYLKVCVQECTISYAYKLQVVRF